MCAVGSGSTCVLAHAPTSAATVRMNRALRITWRLLEAVRQVLEHLVARLDRARVHLVRALRLDHAHELLDDVHIGGLERALVDLAEAVQARRSGLRWAARHGLEVQVLAARLEAGGIHEVRELHRADLHRRALTGEYGRDDTVDADGHRLRAVRHRDRWL